jgi:hypothetical protein
MKLPAILCVLIAGVFGLHILGTLVTTKIRFRLTVNVETPAGLKTGSSVMETVFYRESAFSRLFTDKVSLEGEAVLIDLGTAPDGKRLNLLALLVRGDSTPALPASPLLFLPTICRPIAKPGMHEKGFDMTDQRSPRPRDLPSIAANSAMPIAKSRDYRRGPERKSGEIQSRR